MTCPVCDATVSANDLEAHVAKHFEMRQCPRTDCQQQGTGSDIVAHAEVSASQWQEHVDFHTAQDIAQQEQPPQSIEADQALAASLQLGPHHDSRTDYSRQYLSNLDRALERGQIQFTEYFDRKDALLAGQTQHVAPHAWILDVIPRLIQALQSTRGRQYVLSHPKTLYAASDPGDDGWGCGYRNFQMLASALLALGPRHQRMPDSVPDIPKAQRMLEQAWRDGFDPMGAEQLGGTVVGSRKWIGSTEVATMFYAWNVHAFIVDFWKHSDVRRRGGHAHLLQFVKEYYALPPETSQPARTVAEALMAPSIVIDTQLPPLYLQYQGHSITIIGIDLTDSSLLVFDPSKSMHRRVAHWMQLPTPTTEGIQLFKRDSQSFTRQQYQVVGVKTRQTQDGQLIVATDSETQRDFRRQGAYDVQRRPR